MFLCSVPTSVILRTLSAVLLAMMLMSFGCNRGPKTSVDQLYASIAPPLKKPVNELVVETFGPYHQPKLPETLSEQTVLTSTTPESLQKGRQLYDRYCQQCHGYSGAGDGASAKMMWPKPRDFSRGVFKFTSTTGLHKATRDDLKRTLEEGIPGTYMSSFKLLSEEDRDLIVDYLIQMAIRGEAEKALVDEAWAAGFSADDWEAVGESTEQQKQFEQDAKAFLEEESDLVLSEATSRANRKWVEASLPEALVSPAVKRPATYAASQANPEVHSAENGRLIYLSEAAQCVSCHGEQGKGDGPKTKEIHKRPDGSQYERPGLHDDWGLQTTPRNLRSGVYGGGSRPLDLFRRIHAGIKGSPMPLYGGKALSDEQIWDLVNFIQILPDIKDTTVPIPPSG